MLFLFFRGYASSKVDWFGPKIKKHSWKNRIGPLLGLVVYRDHPRERPAVRKGVNLKLHGSRRENDQHAFDLKESSWDAFREVPGLNWAVEGEELRRITLQHWAVGDREKRERE